MGYFPVRYESRVVIYERKMFIRLATDPVVPLRLLKSSMAPSFANKQKYYELKIIAFSS